MGSAGDSGVRRSGDGCEAAVTRTRQPPDDARPVEKSNSTRCQRIPSRRAAQAPPRWVDVRASTVNAPVLLVFVVSGPARCDGCRSSAVCTKSGSVMIDGLEDRPSRRRHLRRGPTNRSSARPTPRPTASTPPAGTPRPGESLRSRRRSRGRSHYAIVSSRPSRWPLVSWNPSAAAERFFVRVDSQDFCHVDDPRSAGNGVRAPKFSDRRGSGSVSERGR